MKILQLPCFDALGMSLRGWGTVLGGAYVIRRLSYPIQDRTIPAYFPSLFVFTPLKALPYKLARSTRNSLSEQVAFYFPPSSMLGRLTLDACANWFSLTISPPFQLIRPKLARISTFSFCKFYTQVQTCFKNSTLSATFPCLTI